MVWSACTLSIIVFVVVLNGCDASRLRTRKETEYGEIEHGDLSKGSYWKYLSNRSKSSPRYTDHDSLWEKRELIVGGRNAKRGTYPYMVAIVDRETQTPQCGGTLIAKDIVLTAAHCEDVVESAEVQIGRYDFFDHNEDIEVFVRFSIEKHPDPTEFPFRNDFLLIFLEGESSYSPITLNNDPNLPSGAGQSLHIAGWGAKEQNYYLSSVLQDVMVQSITNERCESSKGYIEEASSVQSYKGYIHDEHICALDRGKDSCWGDSGGPLVIKSDSGDVQVGIISWNYACANHNFPGVYARISSGYEWIKNTACRRSVHAGDVFACNSQCNTDEDCGFEYKCTEFGSCKLKNGQRCSHNSNCFQHNCMDGFCRFGGLWQGRACKHGKQCLSGICRNWICT